VRSPCPLPELRIPTPDLSPTLALCFGTRPQVIKASGLLGVLRERWPVMTVDTGQHYDYEMNELLYQQLGVSQPDHFLNVGSGEPAAQTASVMSRTAEVLRRHRPEAVLVIGDTNSTLGSALAACKEGVPVIHIEAGLRSREPMLPEEANRRIVDALSTLLCAPSPGTAARLQAERVPGAVVTTGDVSYDVLLQHLKLIPGPQRPAPFALATIHRAALCSDPDTLQAVLQALGQIGLPVLLPAHPRLQEVLKRHRIADRIPNSISLRLPLGYLEAIAAVRDARVVITDSGGIQREAYWLGTPCVTLRNDTEWVETVECGANKLVPPDRAGEELRSAVTEQCRGQKEHPWSPEAYGDGHAAERVAQAISVTLGLKPISKR
jgi:UDP-N-acetylglucosamine 2-epimerase